MSDRPLAAESIILIEGGAAIGQRPRARSFIIDTVMLPHYTRAAHRRTTRESFWQQTRSL